jgi:hypothetical protein
LRDAQMSSAITCFAMAIEVLATNVYTAAEVFAETIADKGPAFVYEFGRSLLIGNEVLSQRGGFLELVLV